MRSNESKSTSLSNGHTAPASVNFSAQTPAKLIKDLKRLGKGYFRELRKCRRNPKEQSVHHLRVDARRLLSLLDLIEPFLRPKRASLARSVLKDQLDCFDELRDTHVQLDVVEDLCDQFPAARGFRKFLRKREDKIRERTRRHAQKLQQKRLKNLLNACRRGAKKGFHKAGPRQAQVVLLRLLGRTFAEVDRLGGRVDPAETRSIHCARIAFKNFRYMVEPLAGKLPWAGESLLKGMQQYQARMGKVQDAEVLRRAFEKFDRKKRLKAGPALALMEELLRRREHFIAAFMAAAHELPEFRPPLPHRTAVTSFSSESQSVRQRAAPPFPQSRPSGKSSKSRTK